MASMTAVEYVQGLRDFADWVEENADAISEQKHMFDRDIRVLFYCSDEEEFVATLRLLGSGEDTSADKYAAVSRFFGPVEAHVYVTKDRVGSITTEIEIRRVEVSDWTPNAAVEVALQAVTAPAKVTS